MIEGASAVVRGSSDAAMHIPVLSSAALYGASMLDNCRAWKTRYAALVYGLAQHIGRFRRSAELALLGLEIDDDELLVRLAEVLRECPDSGFGRVRMLAYCVAPELCAQRASVVLFSLPVKGYAPARPRLTAG